MICHQELIKLVVVIYSVLELIKLVVVIYSVLELQTALIKVNKGKECQFV